MEQITLKKSRSRLTDIENRLVVAKGEGKEVEWKESLGLVDAKKKKRSLKVYKGVPTVAQRVKNPT